MTKLRVVLDELRCDAHGQCVDACPEVFALDDDDDIVRVLDEHPDASLREKLDRAAMLCPKAAITIEEE
jgi:ferredoxin